MQEESSKRRYEADGYFGIITYMQQNVKVKQKPGYTAFLAFLAPSYPINRLNK